MMLETLGVIYNDFNNASMGLLIAALLFFSISYFISRFFKWAVFRIIILLIAFSMLSEILRQEVILFNLDLYVALGMAAPHLKFAHILMFRIWYALVGYYYKVLGFFQAVYAFFQSLYRNYLHFKAYAKEQKSRWDQRGQRRSEREEEKQKQHSYERQEQEQRRQHYQESKREEQHQRQEQKSQERKGDSASRWESNDPYVILDIPRTATKKEIKSQYRKLLRIYHPDLTQTHKEEYTHIAQRLNFAKDKLGI